MGGILGLCTGFSIITAVEVLYWFSVRIFCDHRTMKKDKSAELPKEEDDASEDKSKEECQQCTKLECEVKKLKSANKEHTEANKQQIEAMKQQMEAMKEQMEATKQQMEATKQELEANTKQQMEVIKQQMEQKIAQLEILLKSNTQSKK